LAIPALITQYSKVAEYGASQFKPYFYLFCSLTQVAVEHRQEWAIAAEGFNLPIEFLEVLRGG
jgi:hypothetical protein